MNGIETILTKPILQSVGWALLHFIWQGSLLALLYAVSTILLRRSSANLRYAVACFGLLLMLATPVVTALMIDRATAEERASATAAVSVKTLNNHSIITLSSGSTQAGAEAGPDSSSNMLQQIQEWWRGQMPDFLPWLVSIWLLGVSALSLRFFGGWIIAQRLRKREVIRAIEEWQERVDRLAWRLQLSRRVRVCKSMIAEVPTVVGWLRPVILLPASALSGLGTEQIEAILAHELAHIRRHDYLVNILQTAIETLLFYHPAVWWLSRQIRIERENCCDDLAVAVYGDVLTYARALTALEEMRLDTPELAIAASGGSLLQRIERLIKGPVSPHRSSAWSAGFIVIAAIFSICVGAQTIFVTKNLQPVHTQTASLYPESEDHGKPEDITAQDQNGEQRSSDSVEDQSDEPEMDEDEAETDSDEISQYDTDETEIDEDSYNDESDETPPQAEGTESGDFIEQMAAIGYTKLTVDQLVAMKIQGVTPAYVRALQAAGYNKLTVDELIGMKIQGVSPEFIQGIKALGYNPTADSLVAMRIQGVTPSFIQAMKEAGYDKLSADELIAMRIQGVTPDYIKKMKEIGFTNLSSDELIAMRIQGVTPAFIQGMKEAGYDKLSADELIAMRIQGVTPEYVRAVNGLGFTNITAEQLIAMRIQGVTPEFIKGMKESGFPNLTINKLIKLRIHDINPAFLKEVKERGFTDLTIDQIIQLKNLGILSKTKK
jgi:beta-lactamase regulating signal transducer with metallopeptidase domain